VGQSQPSRFVVEVWNPFVGAYQAVVSVQEGLRRVRELSDLICQMWWQRRPKLDALSDVPNAVASNGERWANSGSAGRRSEAVIRDTMNGRHG
jgi:hypothetical protein